MMHLLSYGVTVHGFRVHRFRVHRRNEPLSFMDVYDYAGHIRAAVRGYTRLPCETWNIWKEQVVGAVQGMVEETNAS